MKKYILLITFLTATAVFACLNETWKLRSGEDMYVGGEHFLNYDEKALEYKRIEYDSEKMDQLLEEFTKNKDVDAYSDYGIGLIYHEKYKKAEKVYLEIEKIRPGRYATAANLGTLYELWGKNEKALEWIRKAVQIDSTSHENTEWLHVKILEAKIQGESAIQSKFFLNTEFGIDSLPEGSVNMAELIRLRDAIFFQLNERMTFIPPMDPIVALLLFDLGNITFLTDNAETAKINYELAFKYGVKDPLIDKRLALANRISETEKREVEPPGVSEANPNILAKHKKELARDRKWRLIGKISLASVWFCLITFLTILWIRRLNKKRN